MPFISPQAIRNLVFTCVLALLWQTGYAVLSKEFSELERLFTSGKLDDAADVLATLKPSNEEERACQNHYSARLKTKSSEAIQAHVLLIERFPQSEYAQASTLELAKIYILERDMEKAKQYLRKIVSSKIMERFYWLGLCSWWEDDFSGAINHAENYLRLEPKGEYSESAHYLIAECYLAQKKAFSAISTLNKLQSLKLPEIDEQYLLYRLGYAHEQSDKNNDALVYYRRGYELNKSSQTATQIEDRLFELRSRNRNLDISFLYPYTPLQIAIPVVDSLGTSTSPLPNDHAATSSSPELSTPMNQSVKLKSKPSSGYWLQAGRFSMEANANKLVVNIRLLDLPAAYYEDVSAGKKTWVVLSGAFPDKSKADAARGILSAKDINSFVTQY